MGSVDSTATPLGGVQLVDRFIDEPRSLRVAVVGGGLSGITAGILLPAKVPGIQLTIFEKNNELSGTWLTNRYPGVRCDIPSHAYQSTFAPNPQWTDAFSFGGEIRDYWQGVARQHGVYDHVQLGRRVDAAEWSQEAGEWTVTVSDVATGATHVHVFDILITAVGIFDNWALPDYPGLADFQGHLRHAQNWDASFDPAGKRVAVIGNGASGIQLTTNLQKTVARLDHYVRHRTWIASSFAANGEKTDEATVTTQEDGQGAPREPGDLGSDIFHHERKAIPQPYTEKQRAARAADPEAYLAFRKALEIKYWHRFGTVFKNAPANDTLREQFTASMRERVQKKPALLHDLIPDFSPNCRRLTPGPGYLEALAEDNVDYVRTPIRRFTATGIETEDGVVREVDAIICATGADASKSGPGPAPPFPITVAGSTKSLSDVWTAHGHPHTYLGTAAPGFPNLFFVLGPHGSGPSGTVPYSVETQVTHLARILRKVSAEGIRSIVPSRQAALDFEAWATAFFQTTVLSEPCRSWYNAGQPGGYISGMWPGSMAHLATIRRAPRWEDYEYTYLGPADDSGHVNRFAWYFGNGWTKKETDPTADLVSYLHIPGTVPLKDLHDVE
ncbi:uncharacterized protein SPSK_06119 [Sporothrix schenckii 1099-18]|uniref:FAD/NAD(P)-binding domain-containing protein n=2 Tax=Sporothrix schenckii TaxID=29908 RepID=U7PUH1_SPOS1|nr:uncharacterized protein SPSK_06119 [Sporothrix schenckii 1099-18]ERS98125.1 hypothetical protein HMPREF1624_04905 [Sporothrix schenckii ATCC 58251]KJR89784.1 hypothetical protein SPSK_06119 [Sporothrix schenckii 1099-18]